ncbi:MAG: hypothetical protein RMA76_37435 [Deltaproteobacteria bacterium]
MTRERKAARSARRTTWVGAGIALVLALGLFGLPPHFVFSPPVLIGAIAALVFAHVGGGVTARAVAQPGVVGLLAGAALAVVVVGLGAFVGGLAAMLVSPGGFDLFDTYKPVYWVVMVGGVPAIALGCVHAVRVGRVGRVGGEPSSGRVRTAVVAALVLLAPVAITMLFVDRHETVVHAMRLTAVSADAGTYELEFVDFPNHRERIWAPGFGDFVEGRPDGIVNVRHQVMRDFGRVRGYRLLGIDGWDGALDMRGGGASPGPSPWD